MSCFGSAVIRRHKKPHILMHVIKLYRLDNLCLEWAGFELRRVHTRVMCLGTVEHRQRAAPSPAEN